LVARESPDKSLSLIIVLGRHHISNATAAVRTTASVHNTENAISAVVCLGESTAAAAAAAAAEVVVV
jgi:hypothetical protein